MSSSIGIRTLTDGGQQPRRWRASSPSSSRAAQRSLDLAQYDFHLGAETSAVVGGAIRDAHARGVAVRIVYNVDHANPIPVPPPPEPDAQLIASLGVPAKRDRGRPRPDAPQVRRPGREARLDRLDELDRRLVVAAGERDRHVPTRRTLAHAFTLDFEELWTTRRRRAQRLVEPRPVDVDGVEVRPWFTPGFGDALTHRIAKAIGHAEARSDLLAGDHRGAGPGDAGAA